MKKIKIQIDNERMPEIDLTKVKNVVSIDVQPTFIEIEFELKD